VDRLSDPLGGRERVLDPLTLVAEALLFAALRGEVADVARDAVVEVVVERAKVLRVALPRLDLTEPVEVDGCSPQ
jgi:hypothetical protein